MTLREARRCEQSSVARRHCAERSELPLPFPLQIGGCTGNSAGFFCKEKRRAISCGADVVEGQIVVKIYCSDHLTDFLSCMTCYFADVDDARNLFVTRWPGYIQNLHIAPSKVLASAGRNRQWNETSVKKGAFRHGGEAKLTSPHSIRFPETLNSAEMARDKLKILHSQRAAYTVVVFRSSTTTPELLQNSPELQSKFAVQTRSLQLVVLSSSVQHA